MFCTLMLLNCAKIDFLAVIANVPSRWGISSIGRHLVSARLFLWNGVTLMFVIKILWPGMTCSCSNLSKNVNRQPFLAGLTERPDSSLQFAPTVTYSASSRLQCVCRLASALNTAQRPSRAQCKGLLNPLLLLPTNCFVFTHLPRFAASKLP